MFSLSLSLYIYILDVYMPIVYLTYNTNIYYLNNGGPKIIISIVVIKYNYYGFMTMFCAGKF